MAQIHNKNFYQKSIKKYGISAQAVHWNSTFTQYKRFEVLTSFITKEISNATIVDAGCGMGEYYKFLEQKDIIPNEYIGIECEEQMVTISQERLPLLKFYQKNVLEDELVLADYYICSGALNILTHEEAFKFIRKCFEYSRKGFVFNFLKSFSYNNLDTDEVLDFCYTLTDNIKTKDGYLDNDFTIFMLKP